MSDFTREIADQLAGISAAIRKHDTISRAVLEAPPDGMIVWPSATNTMTVCWRDVFAATTACDTASSTWLFTQP